MTAQVLKDPASIIAKGGEALQDNATRQLLNWVVEELKAIRKSLGAASGGAGAGILAGSEVYDAANLVDAAGVTTTGATVTGAALGDYVIMSCSVDLQGITANAYVSAANTVKTRLQNETGGAIDLASATFRYLVIPAAAVSMAAMNLTSQSNQ